MRGPRGDSRRALWAMPLQKGTAMSNSLTPFALETPAGPITIRATEINGFPALLGIDVARALGYGNPAQAVATHVDEQDRLEATLQILEGSRVVARQRTLINESGLYALVFGSKLETAREFRRWVPPRSFRRFGVMAATYVPTPPRISSLRSPNERRPWLKVRCGYCVWRRVSSTRSGWRPRLVMFWRVVSAKSRR